MKVTVLLDGEFVAAENASVNVFDGGYQHGAGLFETMRAENERVFRLDDHYSRLQASAERLLTPIKRELLPHPEQLGELLKRNDLREGRVRLTVTARGALSSANGGEEALTICATALPLSDYPAELYERGLTVVISAYRQSPYDPIAGHKTTCYLPRLIGLREAQLANCGEAIWFTAHNHLAEGSISNIFLVRQGKLFTPPLDTPVLPGIARSVVLELASQEGIEAEESILSIDDLLDADEVFLTNSIMQVMPVVRVEKKDIGNGQVNEIAKRFYQAYRSCVRKECRIE